MFIKTIIILLWNSLFVFNKLQHKITKLMSAFCTQVLRYNVLLNWDNKTNALKFACIVLLFIFILKAKYKIYSFPVVSCGSFPDALWNSSLPSQYNFLWEHSLFLLWSTLIWIFFFLISGYRFIIKYFTWLSYLWSSAMSLPLCQLQKSIYLVLGSYLVLPLFSHS